MVSGLAERLVSALPHLVAARADGRPDGRDDALGAHAVGGLQRAHAGDDRSAGDAPPSGMDGRDGAASLFGEEHRHAVGDPDGDRRARIVADDRIGLRPRPRTGPIA